MINEFLLGRIIFLSDEIKDFCILSYQNTRFIPHYIKLQKIKLSASEIEKFDSFYNKFFDIKENLLKLIGDLQSEDVNGETLANSNLLLKKNIDAFSGINLEFIAFTSSLVSNQNLANVFSFINHVTLEQKILLEKTYGYY